MKWWGVELLDLIQSKKLEKNIFFSILRGVKRCQMTEALVTQSQVSVSKVKFSMVYCLPNSFQWFLQNANIFGGDFICTFFVLRTAHKMVGLKKRRLSVIRNHSKVWLI